MKIYLPCKKKAFTATKHFPIKLHIINEIFIACLLNIGWFVCYNKKLSTSKWKYSANFARNRDVGNDYHFKQSWSWLRNYTFDINVPINFSKVGKQMNVADTQIKLVVWYAFEYSLKQMKLRFTEVDSATETFVIVFFFYIILWLNHQFDRCTTYCASGAGI